MVAGLAGCGGSGSSASSVAPSTVSQPTRSPNPTPSPTGGMSIKGIVYDTGFRYLGGARVEVLDGPQAGTWTTSAANGEFSLTGTFDDSTRFRASDDGHVAATATLNPSCATCVPNRWLYFTLDVLAPAANIAGDYTLTFTADGACPGLPAGLRTRTYAATIAPEQTSSTPGNNLFKVTIGGVPFVDSYKSFRIGVAGNYLGFPDNDGPTLIETIAPNTYLSYDAFGWSSGNIVGASPGPTIATSFAAIEYCVLKSPLAGSFYSSCHSSEALAYTECDGNHRLILTRR